MSYYSGYSAAILGIGFALIQVHNSQALSPIEIKKIAQSITILIQNTHDSSWGAGVIIRRDHQTYTVLTARHVIEGETALKLTLPDGKIYAVEEQSIRTLPNVDLALIQFDSNHSYGVARMDSTKNNLVDSLSCLAGFPALTTTQPKPSFYFNCGQVSVNSMHSLGDGYALGYSNLVLPGMSGGPVLDKHGKLIGIGGYSTTQLSKLQSFQHPEDSASSIYGTSYAVPINTFLGLVPQIKAVSRFSVANISSTQSFNYFMSAVEKLNQKNFKGAIYDFTEDIRRYPNHALSYRDRGFARRKLGDDQGAILDYDQAIRLHPNQADVYYNRGVSRYSLKDGQGAIRDYRQAIRLNPNFANAFYNSGIASYQLGDRQGAIQAFRQAANLYKSHGQTKDYQDAIDKIQLIES
jgi:Trypsin-like peptidase domain/TPR repeat/Tetratricopeptide repeat